MSTITLHLSAAQAAALSRCIAAHTEDLGSLGLDDDERAELAELESIARQLPDPADQPAAAGAPIVWRITPAGAHIATRGGQEVANVYRNDRGQIEAYPWALGQGARGVVTDFEAGRRYVEQSLNS